MIRLLVFIVLAVFVAYCGSTVKIGKRTLFGHIGAIWRTEEVQDLKQGVEDKAGPAVDKMKKGVKAGYEAATKDEGSASGSQAAPAAP